MYTLRIVNGTIVDGSGRAPFKANLFIDGDRIARISPALYPAEKEIDASGLVVAPGFIDIHTHSDMSPYCAPGFESYIHQGVTTTISGNCGGSFVPHKAEAHERKVKGGAGARYKGKLPEVSATDTASYLEEVTGICANNNGMLVGHGALREMCMADYKAELPTPEELAAMKDVLRHELENGAFGLSMGLIYVPGVYSRTEELIELAKVVAEYDSIVTIHMRSEADNVFEAVEEVGRIGRESGAHVHISHFKIMSALHWGKADRLLAQVEALQKEGVKIDFDQYPYLASATPLSSCLPSWVRKLTHEEQLALLNDPERYKQAIPGIEADAHYVIGPQNILVANTCGKATQYDGKFLSEVAADMGTEPIEAYRRLMVMTDISTRGVYFSMNREDALKIARRTDVSVISDSSAMDMITGEIAGVPHPRTANSFVRFLKINREEKLMPLETAVYKMTGLPAAQMKIQERGLLKEGYFADVTIFDPETVADNGTFMEPCKVATGIDRVLLNGETVWADGKPTGARPGRGIRPALQKK